MARLRVHRTLGFLVALVLTASGATRGMCFMPGTGEAGPRDAHACCKQGWTARPPDCCMAGAADEDPARIVLSVALAGPAPAVFAVASLPKATGADAVFLPIDRSHSPPGRVPLRI